jgi:hypothetical protein
MLERMKHDLDFYDAHYYFQISKKKYVNYLSKKAIDRGKRHRRQNAKELFLNYEQIGERNSFSKNQDFH